MSLPYKHGVPGSERISNALMLGGGCGSVVGAVRGTWEWTAPKGESASAGLRRSLMTMGSTVLAFGGIALVYSGTEVLMESLRGKADWRNGAVAGLASGSIIGLQTGKFGSAASAGALFCVASCAIDMQSGNMRGNLFTEDGVPTNPRQLKIGTQKL